MLLFFLFEFEVIFSPDEVNCLGDVFLRLLIEVEREDALSLLLFQHLLEALRMLFTINWGASKRFVFVI